LIGGCIAQIYDQRAAPCSRARSPVIFVTRPTLFRSLIAAVFGFASLGLVSAASGAPAWWRVSNGKTEVWIIGAPRVTPSNFNWDTSGLERRFAGASTLIVGPQARGQAAAAGFALIGVLDLRSLTPMEDSLSPALRQQFVAARQAIGQDAGRYSGWKPAIAGTKLQEDFLKANNLKSGQVEQRVRSLAKSRGLDEAPSGAYDQGELVNEVKTLSQKAQEACLAASLHDISIGADKLRAFADGWAKGEVAAPPIDAIDRACLNAAPAFGAAFDRAAAEDSAAVAQAIARGSPKAVAEFDLPTLIMPGGVLDRLRAKGLQVSGPTE
jgi:uncharacterized protein YbaP (TraB family)